MDQATFIGNNRIQYGEAIYEVDSTSAYVALVDLNESLPFPAKVVMTS